MQTAKSITATAIETTDVELVILLEQKEVRVPWQQCSEKLASANVAQRRQAELSPGGYGIHWPAIDEDLAVGALVKSAGG